LSVSGTFGSAFLMTAPAIGDETDKLASKLNEVAAVLAAQALYFHVTQFSL
jgi:hypothetical protein